MKTLKKLLYIIPLLGAMITSCTDVENIEVEHIGGYNTLGDSEYYANLRAYKPEFGISDSRFSCYARFPTCAYYICPPNNMDGKMQEL